MLKVTHSKTEPMLAAMREAAAIAVGVLEMIGTHVRPGVTTAALDRLCHDWIVDHGGVPACVGYLGYRHATCISVNDVVCHGIPGDRILHEGDVLNIDVVVERNGMHADTSAMYVAGTPSADAARLLRVTQEALYRGILEVCAGKTLGDVDRYMIDGVQRQVMLSARELDVAPAAGFVNQRIVFTHGIGAAMHEPPQVVHVGQRGAGVRLMPGMTFTIEPMLNVGTREVEVLPDGWTVVTRDRALSAQWEHTVLVTSDGFEVLTLRPSEGEGPRGLAPR